jgi:hypothetical protein
VNANTSASTVASGGVAFDPAGAGMTTVTATAPGFDDSFLPHAETVTVNP